MFLTYMYLTRKRRSPSGHDAEGTDFTSATITTTTTADDNNSNNNKQPTKRIRRRGKFEGGDNSNKESHATLPPSEQTPPSATSPGGGGMLGQQHQEGFPSALKRERDNDNGGGGDDDITQRAGQGKRRQERQKSVSNASISQETTRCVCGRKDEEGTMVQCERCLVWQHMHCMGLIAPLPPKRKYFCESCKPRDIKCMCGRTHPDGKLVQCSQCGKFQHSKCVNESVKPFGPEGDVSMKTYVCFNCMIERHHHHSHHHHHNNNNNNNSTNNNNNNSITSSSTASTNTGHGAQPGTPGAGSRHNGSSSNNNNNSGETEGNRRNRSVSSSPRKPVKSAAANMFGYIMSSWVRNGLTEDWGNQPAFNTGKTNRQKKRKTITPLSSMYDMYVVQKYCIQLSAHRKEAGANVLPGADLTNNGENEMIVKGLSTYFNCNETAVLDVFNAIVAPYAPKPLLLSSPQQPRQQQSTTTTTTAATAAAVHVKKETFSYVEETFYPADVIEKIPGLECAEAFPGIVTSVPSGDKRPKVIREEKEDQQQQQQQQERTTEAETRVYATEPLAEGSFICEVCGTVAEPGRMDDEVTVLGSGNGESLLIENANAFDGVFFYPKYPQTVFCVDARTAGNEAHSLRRSCTPNAELRAFAGTSSGPANGKRVRLGLFALKDVEANTELTIAFDYCWKALSRKPPCACGKSGSECEVARWFGDREASLIAACECVRRLMYVDLPPATRSGAGGSAKGSGEGAGQHAAAQGTAQRSKAGRDAEGKDLTPRKTKRKLGHGAALDKSDWEWGNSGSSISMRERRKIEQLEESFRRLESREQKRKRTLPNNGQSTTTTITTTAAATKRQKRRGEDLSQSESSGSSASSSPASTGK